MFSNSFKVVTHSSSCDFKPLFVGSSIEAPSSSSNGPVSGRSMIATGASSLAERSTTQAGDPCAVEERFLWVLLRWLQGACVILVLLRRLCRARVPMVLVAPCREMGMDPSVPLRLP